MFQITCLPRTHTQSLVQYHAGARHFHVHVIIHTMSVVRIVTRAGKSIVKLVRCCYTSPLSSDQLDPRAKCRYKPLHPPEARISISSIKKTFLYHRPPHLPNFPGSDTLVCLNDDMINNFAILMSAILVTAVSFTRACSLTGVILKT